MHPFDRRDNEWFTSKTEAYAAAENLRQKRIVKITKEIDALTKQLECLQNLDLNPETCEETVVRAQLGDVDGIDILKDGFLNLLQAKEIAEQNTSKIENPGRNLP